MTEPIPEPATSDRIAPAQLSIDAIRRLAREIEDMEDAYRHGLTGLAAAGATDVQIAYVAVDRAAKRLTLLGGASTAEIGRAVVEALAHCGRLTAPTGL